MWAPYSLIILILFLVGALPTWPYSANWGYGPSGGLSLVLLVIVILLLTGRIYQVTGKPCWPAGG
ncbi:MAG: DUF3309 domain-containing protein [Nitrospiraceae bacterium]|nr:MAG: DUF3309 domain-containing protein [Nitrospiraceae bacterium]